MSSASLSGKRPLKKSHARHIETSSTSATSAPPTTAESKLLTDRRPKDKNSKIRDSLPDISHRKSNRSLRASNFELSSSANEFTSNALENVAKNKGSTVVNCDSGDHVLKLIQTNSNDQKQYKKQAEHELAELKKQFERMQMMADQERNNPISEYDESINKQQYLNETLEAQVAEAKEKLKNMSHSLKSLRTCRKDCNVHMHDLIIDYNCITKGELSKEIKRFQRLEIDLKNNLDRLHWRMDCESKMYHNLIDQFHKLQMDLYYLKNLNESA